MSIQVELPKDKEEALRSLARKRGLSVEKLTAEVMIDFLDYPSDEEFDRIIDRILKRNAELYQRLA